MKDIQRCSCLNRGPRQTESYTDYRFQISGVRYVVRTNLCKACNTTSNTISILPYPNNATAANRTKYLNSNAAHLAAYQSAYPWR